MRKVICGKVYDTDSATLVSFAKSYDVPYSDFHYIEESVYRKRTGEFFMFAAGGPMTYAVHQCADGTRCSGRVIVPLSEEFAEQVCQWNTDPSETETTYEIKRRYGREGKSFYFHEYASEHAVQV